MSLNPTPSTESQTKNIDPEGDIIFVVGDPKLGLSDLSRLRVSSKVLSLASTAFAAMFSPRWNTTDGKNQSYFGLPREIPLPVDDVEGMTWVCQALHFHKDTPKSISLLLLENLALICDKYNLSTALKYHMGLPLQSFQHGSMNSVDEGKLAKMMYIASVMNNHEVFWQSTMLVLYVCTSKNPYREETQDPTASLFFDGTLGTSL